MSSLKEILILIFVLLGCLVIAFNNYKQPVNENLQQTETFKAILSETSYQVKDLIWNEIKNPEERSENKDFFGYRPIDKQPQDDEKNQHVSENPELVQGNSQPAEKYDKKIGSPEFSRDNISPKTTLSLETILAEAKNLSSDLWLEFQTIRQQDCPSCSQPKNSSPSICATILNVAGGPGCSCAPPCCYPWGCPCSHPCCCVCCSFCCF